MKTELSCLHSPSPSLLGQDGQGALSRDLRMLGCSCQDAKALPPGTASLALVSTPGKANSQAYVLADAELSRGEVGHLLPPPTSCFTKPQSRGKRASSMGSGKGGKGAEGSTAPLWFHVCKFMAYIWQKLDTAKALHPGTLEMHLSSCSTPRGPRMRQDIRGGRRLSLPPAGDPGEDAPSVPPSQDASCHHHAPSMGLSGSS